MFPKFEDKTCLDHLLRLLLSLRKEALMRLVTGDPSPWLSIRTRLIQPINGLNCQQVELHFPKAEEKRTIHGEIASFSGEPIESAGPMVLFGWDSFWYRQAIHFSALKVQNHRLVEVSKALASLISSVHLTPLRLSHAGWKPTRREERGGPRRTQLGERSSTQCQHFTFAASTAAEPLEFLSSRI